MLFLINHGTELDYCCDYYNVFRERTKELQDVIKNSRAKDLEEYIKYREKLMAIYRDVIKGNLQSASTAMRNFISREGFLDTLIENSDNKPLYRYRKLSKKTKICDLYELFHIPFDKRYLVGNERYSINGFPCLYLGDSIACCKEELKCNKESICVGASYIPRATFKYYDLSIKEKLNALSDDNDITKELLKKFLIVYVSSFQVKRLDYNMKFVPFYVIPQMIMASIVSKNIKSKNNICVRYESTVYEGGYNYVFVPKNPKKKREPHDAILWDRFDIVFVQDQD